jgi:exopolysaccharide/PEP-CTERM locus tyrosine autokinase
MSLIESALDKLRRNGESEGARDTAAPRPAQSVSQAKLATATLPALDESARRRISIGTTALRNAGYLPEEGLERRFADHFRQVKRPLIEKALTGAPEMRLLLISSALPGDGKSFTSLNLALSMARERDVSVLLIDADAPRARLSDVLGLRGELGLMDALADESVDVESLIVHTDVRGLEFLPAGRFVENATELLASARMAQIATRLAARNACRVVLLDSAPLLVSSEAKVLLRIPGQVALVVRSGVTPRQAILDALSYVDRAKLQGLILNHAQVRKGGGYYDYAAYGGGGDESSPEAPK